MINNKTIIIPLENSWYHSADFVRQTALVLSKHNQVYIYDQNHAYFFLKRNKKINYPKITKVHFYQVKYYLPFRRFKWLEKLNRRFSFKLFLHQHRQQEQILWLFYPNYLDLAKLKSPQLTTLYDCVDYQEHQQQEQQLIKQVDYFFVNSKALQKLHQTSGRQAHYLQAQGFTQPKQKQLTKTKQTKTIIQTAKGKKVIGYVGGLNCRLDFPLLDYLVSQHPEWQFIFYGPKQYNPSKDLIYQPQTWLKRLGQYPNLSFGQSRKRQQVYQVMQQFDVALIPYNLDLPFNLYCYPMKVFEYLYLAKPIVSSHILELRQPQFKTFVQLAKTKQQWEIAIKKALNTQYTKQQIAQQKQLALDNSWLNKIEQIAAIIHD